MIFHGTWMAVKRRAGSAMYTYTLPPVTTPLTDECCCRAVDLLYHNTVPAGVLASSPGERAGGRNYASIFGRDASLCAIGMAASGIPGLFNGARAGLVTLARYQAENGQIPNFVRPERRGNDFWYSGCIDSTLWWLIAVRLVSRLAPGSGLEDELFPCIQGGLRWLKCQEHPAWGLLQQNEASDWADIMPRSGFVLYSNALWYWVKRLYQLPDAGLTACHARRLFCPFDEPCPENPRLEVMTDYIVRDSRPTPFFLSFVNLSFWGEEIDVFGNLLAALTGLADDAKAEGIIDGLASLDAHRPYPVRVVGIPIEPGQPLWRPYMERHRQNFPFQYHNGGIWPFVGCFWVMLLAQRGRHREARHELERLAALNRINDWEFNEWFHGLTAEPMGMPGQSWSAAMFLLASAFLERKLPLFG
jgi:glycogen debranching enzyme